VPRLDLDTRKIAIGGALLLVAISVWLQIDVRRDARPLGTFADVEALHERDDLNVLFVLIDTLRADRLSAYGYERETSPHIDALAASGVRFARQASQSSWTKCSMASLWTGLYPQRTGVTRSPQALPGDALMPAEILRDAGYKTFAIWRNGWISPRFGFDQGFEVYHSPRAQPLPPSLRRERPTVGVSGTDQDLVLSAVEFLRSHRQERWFLYLHLMDVHQYVYDESSALFGTSYSDAYDNSIRWVDRVLAGLINEIDARGLRDRTMIVIASDHGEAFGEHGREGHARDVYGEVTTTPFIVSFPFRLEPGIVVDTPTENVDLWPTLLDILALPPLETTDGRSRYPELAAAAAGATLETPATPGFAHIDQSWGRTQEAPHPMVAVRRGSYRLVHRTANDTTQLFDVSSDPREQRDVGDDHPEVRDELMALVTAYLEREPVWQAGDDVELGEQELEELRALGYAVP
jgi:arylsulfatase A-like enzyme